MREEYDTLGTFCFASSCCWLERLAAVFNTVVKRLKLSSLRSIAKQSLVFYEAMKPIKTSTSTFSALQAWDALSTAFSLFMSINCRMFYCFRLALHFSSCTLLLYIFSYERDCLRPGGELKPDEDEVDGLKRILTEVSVYKRSRLNVRWISSDFGSWRHSKQPMEGRGMRRYLVSTKLRPASRRCLFCLFILLHIFSIHTSLLTSQNPKK